MQIRWKEGGGTSILVNRLIWECDLFKKTLQWRDTNHYETRERTRGKRRAI